MLRAAAAVALVAIVAAVYWLTRPEPIAVTVAEARVEPVAATVANTRVGTLKACRRALLAPAAAGVVSTLPIKEGARVAPGDMLLEIWNEDLKAEIQLAEAEVNSAAARIDEACTAAAGARREANRLKKLRKDALVSEEQVDIATTDADARQAGCTAAVSAHRVAQARIDVIRARLALTTVRAPFEGTVAEVNAELGEYVTPSPPGIATLPAVDLIDNSCLYVSAPIDEVDAPAIEVGMAASVRFDAFANAAYPGRVRRIAPYVLEREKQARTVEVEVELATSEGLERLLPGYSADIEVVLESNPDALRIPTEAVLEGNTVLVYDPDTRLLEKRTIDTGLKNWSDTEVTAGLQAGERVVTSVGREGVQDGARVVLEAGS